MYVCIYNLIYECHVAAGIESLSFSLESCKSSKSCRGDIKCASSGPNMRHIFSVTLFEEWYIHGFFSRNWRRRHLKCCAQTYNYVPQNARELTV